jgi:hypothetical protein
MARAGNCPDYGGCPGAGMYRLEPGAEMKTTWAKTEDNWRELPKNEVGPYCPSNCVTSDPVPSGAYALHVDASTATVTLPGATEARVVFQ